MKKPDILIHSLFLIIISTLIFLTCSCSAGNSSDVLQNNLASPPVQLRFVVETKTPYLRINEPENKTKTPYISTPTNIPIEFRNWYDPNPSFVLSNEEIKDYLIVNIGISSFGGKSFCAFTPLNKDRGEVGFIYLWVLCQEYFLDQETLSEGTGLSLPVSIQLQDQNGNYEITDHFSPRDGSYYGPDVKRLFPENTWSLIFPVNQDAIHKYNYRSSQLIQEAKRQAVSYFDVIVP